MGAWKCLLSSFPVFVSCYMHTAWSQHLTVLRMTVLGMTVLSMTVLSMTVRSMTVLSMTVLSMTVLSMKVPLQYYNIGIFSMCALKCLFSLSHIYQWLLKRQCRFSTAALVSFSMTLVSGWRFDRKKARFVCFELDKKLFKLKSSICVSFPAWQLGTILQRFLHPSFLPRRSKLECLTLATMSVTVWQNSPFLQLSS